MGFIQKPAKERVWSSGRAAPRAAAARQGAGAEWQTQEQTLENDSLLEWKHSNRMGVVGGIQHGLENLPKIGLVCQSMSAKHLGKVNTYWKAAH